MINKCRDITLDKYIVCLCDKDYTVLGEGTAEAQYAAWEAIQMEYLDLTEDTAVRQAQALQDEINFWDLRYEVINQTVALLRKWRHEDAIKRLHELGYDFEFSAEDTEQYNKDLDRVLTRAKTIVTEQANRRFELKQMGTEADGSQTTRLDMLHNIAVFSQFMRCNIEETTTTLEKYIAIRNLYYKKLDSLKTEAHG